MPRELDHWIAQHIVEGAIASLNPPRGKKVACTRHALRATLLAVAREAHEIGFLAGQKEPRGDLSHLGNADRPAWMVGSSEACTTSASKRCARSGYGAAIRRGL